MILARRDDATVDESNVVAGTKLHGFHAQRVVERDHRARIDDDVVARRGTVARQQDERSGCIHVARNRQR